MIELTFREATTDDQAFITAMLAEALFVPPGDRPFAPDVVQQPDIAEYHAGFGRRHGDVGGIAVADSELAGAAWVRRIHGYGFVDDDTPELTIAVVADHRGRGVGRALLDELFERVPRCSLSCDDRNPAIRLYERVGFERVRTDGRHSVVMLRDRALERSS